MNPHDRVVSRYPSMSPKRTRGVSFVSERNSDNSMEVEGSPSL